MSFCVSVAYFLEDTVQLLNFDPAAVEDSRKRKHNRNNKNDDESEAAVEDDDNMNKFVSNDYSELTRNRVAALSEKEISFELIEVSNLVYQYNLFSKLYLKLPVMYDWYMSLFFIAGNSEIHKRQTDQWCGAGFLAWLELHICFVTSSRSTPDIRLVFASFVKTFVA